MMDLSIISVVAAPNCTPAALPQFDLAPLTRDRVLPVAATGRICHG
jgi:hypothetical protein